MTFKLYLAPLRGFTDNIFRNTFNRHFNGFDAAVAPFISTTETARAKPSHLKDVLPENNPAMPIIPQILGNNPAGFVSLAEQLYEMGYSTINWNLGCPYPMVAKKQRGCGLLPFPDKIDAFLEQTMSSIPNRISIKTRLGRNNSNEIFQLMPIFNRYLLEEIVIHPRTGKQMYGGEADLEAFEKCLESTHHRVVYNGDITNLAAFRRFSSRLKATNRWMIGRAAVANPFLPAIIKCGEDKFREKVAIFRQFYQELFEHYQQEFSGPGHLLERMKGFWTYFSQSFKEGRKIRKKVHRTHKLARYLDIVEKFFEEEAQWKD